MCVLKIIHFKPKLKAHMNDRRICSSALLKCFSVSSDISTLNNFSLSVCLSGANLRIGELQWGDSGLYYCKVVISDDLEGQNEAHVELLVLGEFTIFTQR